MSYLLRQRCYLDDACCGYIYFKQTTLVFIRVLARGRFTVLFHVRILLARLNAIEPSRTGN